MEYLEKHFKISSKSGRIKKKKENRSATKRKL